MSSADMLLSQVGHPAVITAMAFSRDKWVDRTAKILSDAVREYAKQKSELTTSGRCDRSSEIRALLKKAEEMFDPSFSGKTRKTLYAFNLCQAFSEAIQLAALFRCAVSILDASTDQGQVVKVESLLIVAMIKECSPSLVGNLDI
jgi:hypothetical protein